MYNNIQTKPYMLSVAYQFHDDITGASKVEQFFLNTNYRFQEWYTLHGFILYTLYRIILYQFWIT